MKAKRNSKKRDAILELICSTASHPSAQWVYDKLKPRISGLSLGTVYRNIGLFLREGLVVSVGVIQGEEHFDGRVEPHPHCICGRCGGVFDLPCPAGKALSGSAGKNRTGFVIDFRKTVFFGICAACKKRLSL